MLDIELLERLHKSDERALKELFNKFNNVLIFFSTKITKEQLVSEDIVAISFIKIWEARMNFNSIDSIRSFLYKLVRNASINEHIRKKRENNKNSEFKYIIDETYEIFSEAEEERVDVIKKLYDELEKAPPQRKKVVSTFLSELHTHPKQRLAAVAARLHISINTVRVQLMRFRNSFK